MSHRLLAELADAWKARGVFDALHNALDKIGFSDTYVAEMAILGARPEAPNKTKVIKDNVWGMIEIEQSCLRLLDCPILQRMRGVKQLGFSYLTYPSAEHSRFIHSLGIFCVVSRFLETMKRRPPTAEDRPGAPFRVWPVNDEIVRLLEHAAILHDIGHMPFSHVVESILQADDKTFVCGPILHFGVLDYIRVPYGPRCL